MLKRKITMGKCCDNLIEKFHIGDLFLFGSRGIGFILKIVKKNNFCLMVDVFWIKMPGNKRTMQLNFAIYSDFITKI